MLDYSPSRRLSGGLRLAANKGVSTEREIAGAFIPKHLVVAVENAGEEFAEPLVGIGDRVLRGQIVARAAGDSGIANAHAASSGLVIAIEERLVPQGSLLRRQRCIVIATDGRDEGLPLSAARALPTGRVERLAAIREAGIVGLGGAAFPTARKLAALNRCEAVIVNGAECEPYISCDDMLMRRSAEQIIAGSLSICDLVEARLCILAIETDKPAAIERMREAAERCGDERIRLAQISSIYPAGGERQLVEQLMGREIPTRKFASSIDYLCINVGTAFAIYELEHDGRPLLSRIVTVTGRGVASPQNVDTLIGTPIEELIEHCGGYTDGVARLVVGGNMMGVAVPDDRIAITKSSNCVLAATQAELGAPSAEWPCIRCGECALVCPAHLLPQELLRAARSTAQEALGTLGIGDCIECGCCDVVCPSHIPLTATFGRAKQSHERFEQHLELAQQAQRRFEIKLRRQSLEDMETQSQQHELVEGLGTTRSEHATAIAAAVERAKRRRKPGGEDH